MPGNKKYVYLHPYNHGDNPKMAASATYTSRHGKSGIRMMSGMMMSMRSDLRRV